MKKLRLGVVHGPNKGASVPLVDGVYSIGKSEKCDLILSDSSLQDHHIDIFLKDGDITISTMGSDVSVDGRRCTSFHQKLNHFEIITLGTSYIAIGPDEDKWPELAAPVQVSTNEVQPDADVIDNGVDENQINNAGIISQLKNTQHHTTTRIAIPALLISSVAILILIVGLLVPVQAVIQKNSTEGDIVNIIRQHKLDGKVSLEYRQDGSRYVAGYVEDQKTLNKLIAAVMSSSPNTAISVKNTEELAVQSDEIIKALGFEHVNIHAVGAGQLMARGYVVNKVKWDQAKKMIQQDVTGVREVGDSQIYTLDLIATYMTERIADQSLDKWVKVSTLGGSLKVVGKIPKHSRSEWQAIVSDFKNKYGEKIELSNQVIVAKKLKIILPLKSVSVGKSPYLTIDNNQKFIEGSIINKEYTIESILPDRVVIKDAGGNTFDYLIGEHGV